MKPAKVVGGPSKLDLIRWADDRRDVDLQSKVILQKLAFFAQDDGDTWAKVETLADAANCSIRTAQSRLKTLKEDGHLADTGRVHRLKNSTRSVPIYILKPTIEAELAVLSMGANLAPIETEYGCKNGGGMGATACTSNEALEAIENSTEFSTRASAQGDDYGRVEAAFPRLGLGFTNPAMARVALADVVGSGVSVDDLVAAALAYDQAPILKRRDFGPVSLQRWLGEGRYRAWLPVAAVAVEAEMPRTTFAGPSNLRAAIMADPALGEGWARSWLDRCAWDEESREFAPATGEAAKRLPAAAHHFRAFNCTVAAPIPWGKP